MSESNLKTEPGGDPCNYNINQTLYDIWWDPGSGGDPWHIVYCCWPQNNCLPEVVITSSPSPIKTAYEDFVDHYNSDNVSEFFINGNYSILFPALDTMTDVLQGLRDNNILLYKKHEIDNIDYYIGLPDSVHFTLDNFDEWMGKEKCVLRLNQMY